MNTAPDRASAPQSILSHITQAMAIRAPAMIVTIYGDVVVPRGGVLWMGTLVETCAALGLGESLVRTAVSRLVSAGQLVGEREGRRSYYRLAESARQDFAEAAHLLFGPRPERRGWTIRYIPGQDDPPRGAAMAQIGPDLYLAPGPASEPGPGLMFGAELLAGAALMPGWAERLWRLGDYAQGYRRMIALFAPLDEALAQGRALSGTEALVARLLLVHSYRAVLLRDPRLPPEALPPDWPGDEARALFRRLYLALSGQADARIGARMEGSDGLLPRETAETRARLESLSSH